MNILPEVLITVSSLADRDMFMRFRGGGIGHIYMRHIEWSLDAAGWGATWPPLGGKDPNPDPPSESGNGPERNVGNGENGVDDDDGGEGEDEDDEVNERDTDNEDGEDQEQPEDSDGDSDAEGGGIDGVHRLPQSTDLEQDMSDEEESSL